MKENKLVKSIGLFFQRLKPLTWTERIEYLFSYYKEFVFTVGILLVVLIAILFTAFQDRTEVIFGGVFVNVDINAAGYQYISEDVMELMNGDPDTQRVELTSTVFQYPEQVSQLDYNYNAAMKPISMVESGTLDYFVMDEEAMMFYMTQYVLMDLQEVFTADELAQMEEILIYIETETDQKRYPIAIKVNEIPFFAECVEVSEPVFFAFVNQDTDVSAYRSFWQHLLDWQNPAA